MRYLLIDQNLLKLVSGVEIDIYHKKITLNLLITSFLLSPRTVFILRFTVLGGNHFRKDANALPKMH